MPTFTWQNAKTRKPQTADLHKRVTSIGSGEDNDIVIDDPGLEETHALIQFDGSAFTLQSLARGSDVIVNGKVRRRHTLEHGDEILLAGTTAHFQLYDAPRVTGGQPAAPDLTAAYRSILDLSRKLLDRKELGDLLEELMDSIIALSHADKGFLILSDGQSLSVRVARNLDRANIDDAVNQLSDSIVATALQTKRPLIVSDALHDANFASSLSVVSLRLCSVMCVPLVDREKVIGLIYVGNDNVVNLFTETHLELLTIFAAQASLIVANAMLVDDLRVDNAQLRRQLEEIRFGSMIGASEGMLGIYRRIERVAAADISVLVEGETGTGKELIAREIHVRSDRSKGPFVTINCGAIPENLLESELFGHVRGAFTGATANRPGKFQAASGGTLFLDEIGEMPLNLQVKILRALQDRMVTRVGENRPERVDIRVIAATNRDLRQMIQMGTFREDLYYRIAVVTISLPALRERGEDVVLIARYLLDRFVRDFGTPKKQFSQAALVSIRKFAWPGNIRQLENHIKKACILSERGTISPADLDLPEDAERPILPLNEAREEWQREYIRRALALNNGNRTKTARDLGVDPRTVFRFLEREGDREGDPEP